MHIDKAARYTKSHEWVRPEGDLWVVGISDYAQDSLGDVVFVELPKPGATLAAGAVLGVVESVKAASDIYSPLDCTVEVVNTTLVDNPGLVNTDPFGNGWFAKVKAGSLPADLMDAAAYETFCQGL